MSSPRRRPSLFQLIHLESPLVPEERRGWLKCELEMCKMESSGSSHGCFLPLLPASSPPFTHDSSTMSPSSEWMTSAQHAIENLERRLDQDPQQSDKHKSDGQINESPHNPIIVSKTPLKASTSDNYCYGTRPKQLTANCPKPILKSSSSRHKRCSSLGQNIRYIDETPSSLFTPLTCPSTPNPFNLTSPVNCNCSYCNCTYSPKSVPLSTGEEESESWIPKGNNIPCTYCGCAIRDPKAKSLDSSLVPPLASAEQLSVFDYPVPPGDFPHYNQNENVDRQSLYSIHMEKDFRYYYLTSSISINIINAFLPIAGTIFNIRIPDYLSHIL